MYITLIKTVILDYYYSLQIHNKYKFVIDAYNKNIEVNKILTLTVKNTNIILGQSRHINVSYYNYIYSVNYMFLRPDLFVRQLVNIPKLGYETYMYVKQTKLPKRY